jgi:hypothetical protein
MAKKTIKMKINKPTFGRKRLFLAINFVFVVLLLVDLLIYVSGIPWFPWYESSGIQFIFVYNIWPIFLLLGVFLYFYKWALHYSNWNWFLPLCAIPGTLAPLFLEKRFSTNVFPVGAIICLMIIVACVFVTFRDSLVLGKDKRKPPD